MAKFTFTFSSPKPTAKSKKVYEKTRPIIKKNVIGVVGIDISGNYFVTIDGKNYPITLNSYAIKGHNKFYAIELQNNKALCIMEQNKRNTNNKKYQPFTVGSIVKGNTRLIVERERFDFSKVIEIKDLPEESRNYYRDIVHRYKQFYRDNYEEIIKCIN